MKIVFPAAVAVVFLLLFSCSGTAPVIEDIKWRVLYRDDGFHRYEELSVFLRVSDSDGPGDIAQITVTAGDSGLVWYFSRDEWIPGTVGGTEWQGLPGMIPLEGFRMPDTLYTLKLEDLAGRSDERTFRPTPGRPLADQIVWPEVRLEDDVLYLEESFTQGMMILRDENLNKIEVRQVHDGSKVNGGEAFWWELWISLEDTSGGFRLGPYPYLVSES